MDPPSRSTAAHGNVHRPRLPASDENEYAAFAAQLAARSEKFRAGSGPPPPPLGTPVEEPTDRYSLSRLAGGRPGSVWAGGLLLVSIGIAVFAVWDTPDPTAGPSAFAPVAPVEQLKAEQLKAEQPKAEQPKAVEPQRAERPKAPPPKATAPKADPPKADASKTGNVDNILKDILSTKPSAPSTPPDFRQPAQTRATTPAGSQSLTQAEIREMQSRLKNAGFDPGPIDGIVGSRTIAAARKYGEARALGKTEPTKELLSRLRGEPPQSAELGRR